MYSLGLDAIGQKGSAAAIPYFKKASDLDPNFAGAYGLTAVLYGNLGETALAMDYAQRAYALRDRVTENERLYLNQLESSYVTGDLGKDMENIELSIRADPRDSGAYLNMSADKVIFGDYQATIQYAQKALELAPDQSVAAANLAQAYMALNRLDEGKSVLDRVIAAGAAPSAVTSSYYSLAFLRGDSAEMQKQLTIAQQADAADQMLNIQSDTEAFYGRLIPSREFTQRAVDTAQRNGTTEAAATWLVNRALRESFVGLSSDARKATSSAIQMAPKGRYVRAIAALVFAEAGDTAQSQKLVEQLAKEFPQDSQVVSYWLPTAQASLALDRHDSTAALSSLLQAQPYELGILDSGLAPLGVLYLRGRVLLASGKNSEAVAEFQRILDRSGIVLNSPIGALAHLGLARALAAFGDTAKARTSYQDFFALWKDADPDIPILKEAKAEYAKLQ